MLRRLGPFSLFILCTSILQADVPFSLTISEQLRSTFTLVGSGARAAGMGGAFTAVADDATAASFNPAGLAQLVLPEASVVFDRPYLTTDHFIDFVVLDPQGPSSSFSDSNVEFAQNSFNFLSFTVPFQISNHTWAVQFSTQRAVDLTYHGDRRFSEIDQSVPIVDIRQKSDQSGGIRLYFGSLAVSATRRMLLGITINYWKGDWKYAGINSETPVEDPSQTEFLNYTQTNTLSGWNYDLGMLLRYKYGNFGIRYRSDFSGDYRLHAEVDTNIDETLQPLPDTLTKLEWPSTINLGLAVKPNDRLTMAVDFGRTNWSKMIFDVGGSTGTPGRINFFDLKTPAETLVKPANVWRAGGEYLYFAGSVVLPARAGWFYEPQPGVDVGTRKRIIVKGITAGAGMKTGWFALDFAYQRRTSSSPITLFEPDDVVIGDFLNPSNGKLDRTQNRFLLSTIFQLPSSTSLSRIIHNIFIGPKEDSGK